MIGKPLTIIKIKNIKEMMKKAEISIFIEEGIGGQFFLEKTKKWTRALKIC